MYYFSHQTSHPKLNAMHNAMLMIHIIKDQKSIFQSAHSLRSSEGVTNGSSMRFMAKSLQSMLFGELAIVFSRQYEEVSSKERRTK